MSFLGGENQSSTGSDGGVGPAGRKTSGKLGTRKDARQASKRNEFRNQGARDIKAKVKKIPSPVLRILSKPLQAGSRITRDFFTNKVLGSKNFKGTSKNKFESMSLLDQEKMYKNYMSNRLAGKTDAYGNPISGGIGNSQITKPILGSDIQKTAVKKAPDGPTIAEIAQEDTEEQRLAKIKRKGRKSTKLSKEDDELTLSKKTLLG